MKRWRVRAYLVVFAALTIAAGIVAQALPHHAIRILAGVAIIGGLAMLVVAMANGNGNGHE